MVACGEVVKERLRWRKGEKETRALSFVFQHSIRPNTKALSSSENHMAMPRSTSYTGRKQVGQFLW